MTIAWTTPAPHRPWSSHTRGPAGRARIRRAAWKAGTPSRALAAARPRRALSRPLRGADRAGRAGLRAVDPGHRVPAGSGRAAGAAVPAPLRRGARPGHRAGPATLGPSRDDAPAAARAADPGWAHRAGPYPVFPSDSDAAQAIAWLLEAQGSDSPRGPVTRPRPWPRRARRPGPGPVEPPHPPVPQRLEAARLEVARRDTARLGGDDQPVGVAGGRLPDPLRDERALDALTSCRVRSPRRPRATPSGGGGTAQRRRPAGRPARRGRAARRGRGRGAARAPARRRPRHRSSRRPRSRPRRRRSSRPGRPLGSRCRRGRGAVADAAIDRRGIERGSGAGTASRQRRFVADQPTRGPGAEIERQDPVEQVRQQPQPERAIERRSRGSTASPRPTSSPSSSRSHRDADAARAFHSVR